MKALLKITAFCASLALMAGCDKDEKRIYFDEGTAPSLSTSTNAPVLKTDPIFDKEEVMTLTWTNPEYAFTTGPSSQDVNYRIELDTVGAGFGSAKKGTISVAKELSKTFTTGELNALLSGLGSGQMALTPDREYLMEARVTSTIGTSALPLTSNTIQFRVTPFSPPPVVPVPDAGTLWGVGDAFSSGWNNPLPAPYDVNQKFTRINKTLYELVVNMPGGGGYKLIQQQGVWGTQYKYISGGNNSWEGGDFEKKDADPAFPGPPTAGKYKITVNFLSGKFTVAKQP